ncbi:MAG: hypothetical protein PHU64_03975 [Candidatus Omnitrophica bacterium]|nr:hypothetical protein [Candidatus Omnitrophota bacterium]MDD5429296.1 hypothetical protein [Candidatus Omnitrophota bacterium]
MEKYESKRKKMTVFIYIIITIVCFFTGATISYASRKLPMMRMRYEALVSQAEEEASSVTSAYRRDKVDYSALDDFAFEKIYKPMHGIANSWKSYVKGSLRVERRRVIDEKIR